MFKDHFSTAAKHYARYRPDYPADLFRWLADLAPARQRAWDAATGTGQAALGLAGHFEQVIATDASVEQIRHARPHPAVRYEVAPSEYVPIENDTVDLVLVAQALHWFEFDAFYGEVRRVAKPSTVVCAACYGLFRIDAAIDEVIDRLYEELLGDYWPPERRHVDDGYRSIPFPFDQIEPPTFEMSARWTLDHLLGYLGTWSAVSRARAEAGTDPLGQVEPELRRCWGEPLDFRPVSWALNLRAGRL